MSLSLTKVRRGPGRDAARPTVAPAAGLKTSFSFFLRRPPPCKAPGANDGSAISRSSWCARRLRYAGLAPARAWYASSAWPAQNARRFPTSAFSHGHAAHTGCSAVVGIRPPWRRTAATRRRSAAMRAWPTGPRKCGSVFRRDGMVTSQMRSGRSQHGRILRRYTTDADYITPWRPSLPVITRPGRPGMLGMLGTKSPHEHAHGRQQRRSRSRSYARCCVLAIIATLWTCFRVLPAPKLSSTWHTHIPPTQIIALQANANIQPVARGIPLTQRSLLKRCPDHRLGMPSLSTQPSNYPQHELRSRASA